METISITYMDTGSRVVKVKTLTPEGFAKAFFSQNTRRLYVQACGRTFVYLVIDPAEHLELPELLVTERAWAVCREAIEKAAAIVGNSRTQ